MEEQNYNKEKIQEFDKDSYTIEDKLFNMNASQTSEYSGKSLRRDF